MNAPKFTPGPWTVEVSQNLSHTARVVCNSDGEFGDDICLVGDVTKGNNAADASLIAAAPDLYQSLLEMAEDSDDVDDGKLPKISAATLTRARQALAKAVTP